MSVKLIERAAEAIRLAAAIHKKEPYDLTKGEFMSTLPHAKSGITEWDVRKLGGFAACRKASFPEPADLPGKRGVAIRKAYVSKLEREAGNFDYYLDAVAAKMGEVLAENPIKVAKVKPLVFKALKDDKTREVVAFISDTHFGLEIDNAEVPTNTYSWEIAARRMGKFAEQVASYKIDHRGSTPRLRLLLGGDLAQGVIHLDDAGTDLITNQVLGTVDILTKMIDYLRYYFKEIVVECVPCNHLRLPHKAPGRATAQKWDAFSTMIHGMLQAAYRETDQVVFHVAKTPYADFEILGNRFYMTHGDTVFEVGNPGTDISVKNITNKVNTLNANVKGQRYSVVLIGHVHTPLCITLTRAGGVELIVNGTGSGADPYSQSIGYEASVAVQTIFEVTKGFPVGDYRKIHLDDASFDRRYESIVSPWNHSLELKKIGGKS